MSYFLREISREDISAINQWRNDRKIIDQLGGPFRFINRETDESWFVSYMGSRSNSVRLAIIEKIENIIVGAVYLTGIDWIVRSAEFSIWIGNSDYHGKGVGKIASLQMLKHAFEDLGLNRVYLTVLAANDRARRLYKSVGFSEEGVLRQSAYKNGEYLDMIQMSILAEDYNFPNNVC